MRRPARTRRGGGQSRLAWLNMGAKRSRDERKDRAAEQRRIQRAHDRRQRRIVYGIAAPVALLIIAIVPFTDWYHAHQRGQQHSVGYVRKASAAAKAAGCTGVRNDRQIPTSIVKAGTTVDYAALTAKAGNALPPTSGPREASVLADTPAFFALASAPHPERAVGNLNHGYIVVWYDSQLPAKDVKALQAASNTRTLTVPWTRSVFPDGRHVVFTAWDRTQRCTSASATALGEFATAHRDDASGKNWASPSAPTPGGAAGATPAPSASVTVKPSASASSAPSTTPSTTPASPAPASGSEAPLAPLPGTSSTVP